MKPRIRKLQGLWYCRSPEATGLGYTPLHAWNDWADLFTLYWRKRA